MSASLSMNVIAFIFTPFSQNFSVAQPKTISILKKNKTVTDLLLLYVSAKALY